jgi:hypothetical protein
MIHTCAHVLYISQGGNLIYSWLEFQLDPFRVGCDGDDLVWG